MPQHPWKSKLEDNSQELVLFFYHAGSGEHSISGLAAKAFSHRAILPATGSVLDQWEMNPQTHHPQTRRTIPLLLLDTSKPNP